MAENFLRYTSLTYDDLLESVRSKLLADPRFENFRESQISSMLIEIFAAFADFTNYYIERQAEEKFFDTAKLKSSAILLSRLLGYVVSRPNPAETSISMDIIGPLPNGLVAGNQLTLNRKTPFSLNGTSFVLKNTYRYTFTSSDIVNGIGNTNFLKTINFGLVSNSSNYDLIVSASSVSAANTVDIVLMQGEIKSETILGVDTDQIGLKFQKYKLIDTSFSNIYSENDLGYDSDTGSHDQSQNFTRVAIDAFDVFAAEEAGSLSNYDSFYDIDKRTLLRPDSPLTNTFTSAIPLCLLRTTPDGNIEIIFGDDFFSKLGLRNTNNNVYVQYFSTLGKQANQIGVVGQLLQTDTQFLVNSIDVSNNLVFKLRKNILGGTDLEDLDSIKFNAPGIFNSLDRCVTKRDYISFLKTITSPLNVKNAIAWGEQEEIGVIGSPIKKLFNIVLFSVLGELYDVDSDIHQVKMNSGNSDNNALSAAVLDDPYTPYANVPNSYLSILVKESIVDELNFISGLSETSKIKQVLNKLNTKSQITAKNVYVTPFINEFDIVGTVYVKKLSNINFIQKSINNKIYEWLNLNADFDSPIYKSKITEIIENNPNVVSTDFDFIPFETSGTTFNFNSSTSAIVDDDITNWIPVGGESITAIEQIYASNIIEYFSNRTSYSFEDIKTLFTYVEAKNISKQFLNDFTERNFYNELAKNLYNDLKTLAGNGIVNPFADSVNFDNTILKLRNTFNHMILWDMLDTNGNIVNFSLNNQIAKLKIQLTYVYR